jgi:CRISPR system Cascade subunit CasA
MPDRFDLLLEEVFTMRLASGVERTGSLPTVLATLSGDDVEDFPALRPHQEQAWYCFLVQLAAIALHHAGRADPPADEETWRGLLTALTGRRHEPWTLVVEDLSQPAFFQPPLQEKTPPNWKNTLSAPDELDLLFTGKNHDLKKSRLRRPATEHWAFALVTLQTLDGYGGKGNYGIARMNGGYASRPFVGFAPGLRWGERFRRDLATLIDLHDRIVSDHHYGGLKALLWSFPWDGHDTISPVDCDPFFVEICRRIRLFQGADGALSARTIPTDTARISADRLHGVLGDPWIPIDRTKGDPKALKVGRSGFPYDRFQEILFTGDFADGAARLPNRGDPAEGAVLAQAIARAQGGTEGFHERVLPIPRAVRQRLGSVDGRTGIGQAAKRRVEVVAEARRSVLGPAVRSLLSGSSDQKRPGKRKGPDPAARWLTALDREIDAVFFDDLWASLDLPAEEAETRWQKKVVDAARKQLEDAKRAAPIPSIRRYRAEAEADRIFEGSARTRLPMAFERRSRATQLEAKDAS